jgi:signal transduction histidine kinase
MNGSSRPSNSQEALALSIARAIELGLPGPDTPEAIRSLVADAVRAEARANERSLAYARVALLGLGALIALVVVLAPGLFGIQAFPIAVSGVLLACTGIAAVVAVAIRRGWYRRWLRWAVPAFDALAILGSLGLLFVWLDRNALPVPVGSLAVAAVACALLAFSGALRLSRSAARAATLIAVACWAAVAFLAAVPPLTGAVVGLLVLATGVLSARVTRIIRRVITDEVARLRLTRMYQDAQETINAREEVLRIVSHDLRNPLGTIAMAADLLLDLPASDELRARQLGIIKRNGERMNRLIHDLLDAARVEAGSLPIRQEVVDVGDLFENVVEMMRPLAEEQGLSLHVVLAERLPRVRADSERILQVFSNLIGNAIKFTPKGGHITLRADPMGTKVRMAVVDTGPGIPPDQLADIFRKMWQARKDDTRGIGLGLTIAKAIVEAHGERIGVESQVGRGTEFWFTVGVAASLFDRPQDASGTVSEARAEHLLPSP